MKQGPGRSEKRELTVVSIPAGHVYPATIRPGEVHFPPDPVVDPAHPDRWWPHPLLDAAWWSDPAHADAVDAVDVVHLHFGFEHLSLTQTRAFLDALARLGIPLVLTVHDLDNPHLADQTDFHRQLAVLCEGAQVVLTLTEEARRRIEADYGVSAEVVPHPRVVVDPAAVVTHRSAASRVVGVFLKSLRANTVAEPGFHLRLADAVTADGALLRIHLHDDRADSDLGRALADAAADGRLELRLHPPLADADLYSAVADCGVVLLPYTRGTHSGWLEMCRDLGVSVAAPDCGCYLSQADDPAAVGSYRTGDPESAARAVLQLLQDGPIPYQGDRVGQLESVIDRHRRIYGGVA